MTDTNSNNPQLNDLIEAILALKKKEELLDFLEGILSPKELNEISTRLQIIKHLKAGVPQAEISEKLGVGIATVTRGSKEIQRGRFQQFPNWR